MLIDNPYTHYISFRFRHPNQSLQKEYNIFKGNEYFSLGYLQDIGKNLIGSDGKNRDRINDHSYFYTNIDHGKEGENMRSLEDAIESILDVIKPLKTVLDDLVNRGGSVEFFVSLKIKQNTGISISSGLLRELASSNINLSLDIYQ